MRRVLLAIVVGVLIAAPAEVAFGQCSISTLEINGVVTLCADAGDAWEWTGPGGFSSSAMCVDAIVHGTYTLRVFDATSGTWSAPCSQVVGTPTGPSCSITGADSVCAGAAAAWCGPEGDFLYAWSGPGGFSATTPCVEVSLAGDYTLTLTDPASGTPGEPCTRTLVVRDCAPPPPPESLCPAPARWWSNACEVLDPELLARIAVMVDERSAAWSFGGESRGLCELLEKKRHGRAVHNARRQFAAVHANLVAAELGMRDAGGMRIGLDPDATLDHVAGVAPGTTLREWVAATEAMLVEIGDGPCRDRSSRSDCCRIRDQACAINSGSREGGCFVSRHAVLDDDDDDDDLGGFGPSAGFSVAGTANPFPGSSRLRWTLQRAGEVQLDMIDLSGRRVRRLVQGAYPPGTHEVAWDGRDDGGRLLRPGAYFVTGRVLDLRVGQRLILLR